MSKERGELRPALLSEGESQQYYGDKVTKSLESKEIFKSHPRIYFTTKQLDIVIVWTFQHLYKKYPPQSFVYIETLPEAQQTLSLGHPLKFLSIEKLI